MVLTHSEQSLVETLAALPPNNVYVDAEKREIFTGFRFYTDRRITHIGWEADAVLLLELAGDPDSARSRPAFVRVSRKGDFLRFSAPIPSITAAGDAATSWPPC